MATNVYNEQLEEYYLCSVAVYIFQPSDIYNEQLAQSW